MLLGAQGSTASGTYGKDRRKKKIIKNPNKLLTTFPLSCNPRASQQDSFEMAVE